MRLRKKPEMPKRRKVEREVEIYSDNTLSGFIEWAEAMGVDPRDVKVYSYCYYHGCEYMADTMVFRALVDESDEEFNERMNKYNDRLLKYNKWYAKNKTEIEAELKRRQKAKQDEEKRKAEREIKSKKARKAKLERELKKLKKEVREE